MSDLSGTSDAASGTLIAFRMLAERAMVRITSCGSMNIYELKLGEIERMRGNLDIILFHLENGTSVAPSLAALLKTLPTRTEPEDEEEDDIL